MRWLYALKTLGRPTDTRGSLDGQSGMKGLQFARKVDIAALKKKEPLVSLTHSYFPFLCSTCGTVKVAEMTLPWSALLQSNLLPCSHLHERPSSRDQMLE